MTEQVLCAFSASENTQSKMVPFLTCWDESQDEPAAKAKYCAGEAGIDYSRLSTCLSSGESAKLLAAAANAFVTRFPEHATGRFNVPHIYVNNVEEQNTDYQTLLKALCSSGIKAGACGGEELQV